MKLLNWIVSFFHLKDSAHANVEFPPSERVRKHFVFSGTVQGVGFRYEVRSLAEELLLTGWVRNLPDGEVEAEIEGESERIDFLIASLLSIRRFHIVGIREENVHPKMSEAFHIT